ncbi:patatin-like phospholipase family protein [candidate division KSB1 bacterium]|nr:patatin-like phospholipase family protein [candidate division KSB1 bacterium]
MRSIVPKKKLKRPRVGLTLSGGGIRGIAQVGVLKVLEEENIPIDVIVGSSIGGVIGGLYAAGYSPDEIIDLARSTEWSAVISDAPQRSTLFLGEKEKRGRALLQFRMDFFKPVVPEAYSPGQKLYTTFTELILNAYYHASHFDQLKIPLKIISTDILTGEKIVLTQGDLAQAMRATVGIPLLFSPVEYKNYSLVDGGVVDNIPVVETKKSGVDVVIAVDTTSPLRSPDKIAAPWEIADQITTIMQQEKDKSQLDSADVAICFDDLRIVSTNFAALDFLYKEGIRRTQLQITKIKDILQDVENKESSAESFRIDQITVSGANRDELARFINMQQKKFSSCDIRTILKNIYSSGQVDNVAAKIYQADEKSILSFDIDFNPELNSIVFYGNSQIPDDSLRQHFSHLLNQPINHHKIQLAVERILKMYRTRGLSLAKIEKINFNPYDHSAHVYIFEGLVKNINLSGLQKTQPFVISREFDIKKGDLFRFDRAQNGIKNIYATDLFSAVNLIISSESIYHDIYLHFIEKPSHVVRIGARYDSERTARIFAEFADENIWGTGNDLSLHLQYGGRDFKTFVEYRADRIFKSYLTSRFNLHHFESDHFAYTNLERTGQYVRHATGLNIDIGQQIGRFGTLSGHLRFEKIDLYSVSGYGYDTGSLNINTFGMKTIIDTRDEVPFPASGKYHIFFYEISSGLVLGADASFYKVMNQLATYTTYWNRHTFCPKLIWGTSETSTPYSEQFRLGGQDSFYGWREGQIWGKHMILTSLEYRLLLPNIWMFNTYLSARYDLGAMWAKMEEIRANDFTSGYGAAISFKTPVGPFSFAYGHTNRGQRQFYFSAGFEF